MTGRVFRRTFESFLGEDLRSTDLTKDPNFAKALTNYQFAEGASIKGISGMQVVAQSGGFLGLHNYTYVDATTGATREEMLAINDHLWKLKSQVLSVTGGSNMNHTVRVNSGTATYRMVINSGATPYTFSGNGYIDLGTGLENLPFTVEDLRAAIDANATLACALPSGIRFARVNGTQTGVSVITVDAGHNYVVNDVIVFWDYATSKLTQRRVTAVTGTTITFNSAYGTVNVQDNQVIGPMASPAACIAINDAYTSTSSTLSLTFYYWDAIPFTSDCFTYSQAPFAALWNTKDSAGWTHPCFLNANNVCYIYTTGVGFTDYSHHGYPHKYDGNAVYREGMPYAPQPEFVSNAAGALTGLYRYKQQYIFDDGKGNIIEGQVNDFPLEITLSAQIPTLRFKTAQIANSEAVGSVNGVQAGVTTITIFANHFIRAGDVVVFFDSLTGAITQKTVSATTATTFTINGPAVNVADQAGIFKSPYTGMRFDGAVVNGIQANVNTVTVIASTSAATPNRVRVGDKIFFLNTKTRGLDSRIVTAVTSTTITFSGDSASFDANTIISSGLYIRIWRNKAGGNLFYKLDELANHYTEFFTYGYAVGAAYQDTKADSALGEQLIDNPLDLEANIPVKARFACVHQGGRVLSGIDAQPNTVGIYSTLNIEAVPLASNYFDVPSSGTGGITGIASDGDDRLAVFKPNAYFDVTGFLEDLAFSIRTVSDGDYGISSHASLRKINQKIIGMGKLGLLAVIDGQITPILGNAISPLILNNINVDLTRAIAANDFTSESYDIYIPNNITLASNSSLSNDIHYSLDYKNDNAWFSREFPDSMEPSGGFAIYGDVQYVLSKSFGTGSRAANPGNVFRRISGVTTESLKYSFNTLPHSTSWRTAWEHLDKPSINKQFLEVRIFSLPGAYEQKTAFTLSCQVFRNFYELTNDGVSPSFVFNGSTDFEATNKVKSIKSRAIQFLFSTSGYGECPFISGLEFVITPSYDEDDLAK